MWTYLFTKINISYLGYHLWYSGWVSKNRIWKWDYQDTRPLSQGVISQNE